MALTGSLLSFFNGVLPAEGATDAYNNLVNLINTNINIAGGPQSVLNATCTAALTATSNTTLASVTGLSAIPLTAGATYTIKGMLTGSAAAAGGIKAALVGSNGLTLTSMNLTGFNFNGATINTVANVTAMSADFSNSAAAYTNLSFEGSFVVNAAGTLLVQAAQNTSNATSTVVGTGSYITLTRVS